MLSLKLATDICDPPFILARAPLIVFIIVLRDALLASLMLFNPFIF